MIVISAFTLYSNNSLEITFVESHGCNEDPLCFWHIFGCYGLTNRDGAACMPSLGWGIFKDSLRGICKKTINKRGSSEIPLLTDEPLFVCKLELPSFQVFTPGTLVNERR